MTNMFNRPLTPLQAAPEPAISETGRFSFLTWKIRSGSGQAKFPKSLSDNASNQGAGMGFGPMPAPIFLLLLNRSAVKFSFELSSLFRNSSIIPMDYLLLSFCKMTGALGGQAIIPCLSPKGKSPPMRHFAKIQLLHKILQQL